MLKITDKKIIKTHALNFLESYYAFTTQKKSEKETIIEQLTHLRPIIGFYQSTTNDMEGEQLDLVCSSLKSEYFLACKMIHPETHFSHYDPDELKHDFESIYKYLFSKKKYAKLNKKISYEYNGPESLLAIYADAH